MMLDIACSGMGMFSMGNIKPLNNKAGSNIPIKEINMATCCELVRTEIRIPIDKQVMMNKVLMAYNNKRLPLIGKLSTNTLNNKIELTFTNDNKR